MRRTGLLGYAVFCAATGESTPRHVRAPAATATRIVILPFCRRSRDTISDIPANENHHVLSRVESGMTLLYTVFIPARK
jgi:hypothetical protein